MKKLSSKAIVLLVALAMFFAFQTGVSANNLVTALAGNTTATISGSIGDSFNLYKLINVTYNSTTNTVSYTWTTNAQAFINSTGSGYNGLTVAAFQGYSQAQTDAFLGKFSQYVKTAANNITADATTGTLTGTSATVSTLKVGEYVVLGAGNPSGAKVYQITTVSFLPNNSFDVTTTAAVTPKSTTPTISKAVNDQQVFIGEIVTYTVTVFVPTYSSSPNGITFNVADVLPAGVTFASTTSVKAGTGSTLLTSGTDYTTTGASWNFVYSKISGYAGQSIVITYTGTVNNNIVVGSANTNTATLTYSTNGYDASTSQVSASASIYSYGIEIFKIKKSDSTTKLGGASFELHKGTSTGTVVTTLTTDSNGTITYKGLDVGDYYLVETVAPIGYVLDATPLKVTITDTGVDGNVDANASPTTSITGYNGYITTTIENTAANFVLPDTGGIGTWVFTIVGVLVMAGAVLFLVVSSRKKKEQATK